MKGPLHDPPTPHFLPPQARCPPWGPQRLQARLLRHPARSHREQCLGSMRAVSRPFDTLRALCLTKNSSTTTRPAWNRFSKNSATFPSMKIDFCSIRFAKRITFSTPIFVKKPEYMGIPSTKTPTPGGFPHSFFYSFLMPVPLFSAGPVLHVFCRACPALLAGPVLRSL